jgi:hypothetical protein
VGNAIYSNTGNRSKIVQDSILPWIIALNKKFQKSFTDNEKRYTWRIRKSLLRGDLEARKIISRDGLRRYYDKKRGRGYEDEIPSMD